MAGPQPSSTEGQAGPMDLDSSGAPGPRVAGEAETGCSDRERFLLELEFVQGLANPHYLNWLAQNRYMSDPAFIEYINYLQYWREQPYRKFLVYPQALLFLDLLQSENFRAAIIKPDVREMVHRQQLYFWRHFRSNRVKEEMEAATAENPPPAPVSQQGPLPANGNA